MVGIFAHDGGSFKPATSVPVKNGSTWQNAQEVWANNNGVWTKVFPAIVREPPTGENWTQGIFQWVRVPQINQAAITWGQNTVGYAGINDTSFTIGSWTYYRGSLKMTNYYALYRIGTP